MSEATTRYIKCKPRGGTYGFTLMELMVSTLLLSIVMGSVYTLFTSVIGTWRSVEDDFDLYQDARVAMSIIGREFENILPQAGHLFEGDDRKVTLFVVSQPFAPDARGRGSVEGDQLMRVQYEFRRSRDGGELQRTEALVQTALPVAPPPGTALDRKRIKLSRPSRPFTLLGNVDSLQFRYVWMPLPKEQRPANLPPKPIEPLYARQHKERWGLPQGIEISLEMTDPQDTSQVLSITQEFPIRAPSYRRSLSDLREMGVR
jgi:prepilin-type N-terminal cleavage/methylation domain-containing protein